MTPPLQSLEGRAENKHPGFSTGGIAGNTGGYAAAASMLGRLWLWLWRRLWRRLRRAGVVRYPCAAACRRALFWIEFAQSLRKLEENCAISDQNTVRSEKFRCFIEKNRRLTCARRKIRAIFFLLHRRSPIAQSVERRTVNPQVAGSSPARGAKQKVVKRSTDTRNRRKAVFAFAGSILEAPFWKPLLRPNIRHGPKSTLPLPTFPQSRRGRRPLSCTTGMHLRRHAMTYDANPTPETAERRFLL